MFNTQWWTLSYFSGCLHILIWKPALMKWALNWEESLPSFKCFCLKGRTWWWFVALYYKVHSQYIYQFVLVHTYSLFKILNLIFAREKTFVKLFSETTYRSPLHPMQPGLSYWIDIRLSGLGCTIDDIVYHVTIWYKVILLNRMTYDVIYMYWVILLNKITFLV